MNHIETNGWAYKEGWIIGDEICRVNGVRIPEDQTLITPDELVSLCKERPLALQRKRYDV